MSKTTKIIRGIHSWIKFQKHQGVQSLTIKGKDALADLSQDKNGDTNLILNADKDKLNAVASNVSYLAIAHTTTGTDPNQEKTATISQDLTQFPLSAGELVTVIKETDSLTIHDEKYSTGEAFRPPSQPIFSIRACENSRIFFVALLFHAIRRRKMLLLEWIWRQGYAPKACKRPVCSRRLPRGPLSFLLSV
mgnify:CR=1 FL=1